MVQSTMNNSSDIFIYNWQVEEAIINGDMQNEIFIYGIVKNKTICLRVCDFDPVVYVQLPLELKSKNGAEKTGGQISWDQTNAQFVVNYINHRLHPQSHDVKKNQIVSWSLENLHKLYYAHLNKDKEYQTFPYLKLSFKSMKTAKKVSYMCQQYQSKQKQVLNIPNIGPLVLTVNECEATSILQLSQRQKIPTCGWCTVSGMFECDIRETSCDYEYRVSYKNIHSCTNMELQDQSISPTILSFDIECNSTIQSAMPKSEDPRDVIFQIGISIAKHNEKNRQMLLSLGEVDPISDVEILTFTDEDKLLMGFNKLVKTIKPQIVTGYNIFSFDLPYMLKRADMYGIKNEFLKLGYRTHKSDEVRQVNWSSKAYSKQELEFIDTHGILMLDALPVIKRDYKFSNYKLSTVASNLIGKTKDPLNAYDIFNCYLIGMKGGSLGKTALKTVGKYCVVDASVVLDIIQHTNMWISLSEMAKTCNVPITYLFTKGEQIKAYSQIFCESKRRNFVVETNVIDVPDDFSYTGALVIEPVPGIYPHVVPFDFTSLYPTTIISYNIDYTTFVDESTTGVPDEDCHVFEWSEHQGCDHDPQKILLDKIKTDLNELRNKKKMTNEPAKKKEIDAEICELMVKKSHIHTPSNVICKKFKYKFLKKPLGIVPAMLTKLLHERKKVKTAIRKNLQQIPSCDINKQLQLKAENAVLDKRQLSYKIAANSMYGCMGVKRGYLPLPQGACCTTAQGRVNITKAQNVLKQKYNANIVYGDTDSCYVQFDTVKTDDLWSHCLKIESELVRDKVFPSPMKLAFEESVYPSFLIMSKKRYIATSCDESGKLNDSLVKKGVLLSRRDNCNFTRNTYKTIIEMIFRSSSYEQCVAHLQSRIDDLLLNKIHTSEFFITKSVQSKDEYKHKKLDIDGTKRTKQLKDVGFTKLTATISELFDLYSRFNNDKIESIKKRFVNSDDMQEHVYNILSELYNTTECLRIMEELYYEVHSLPAVVQLAEKMKSRGTHVPGGSRLEYVYVQSHTGIDKLWDKIEDTEYFSRHSDVLTLDYSYYIKSLVNPIDEIFDIVYKKKNTMKNMHHHYCTILTKNYVSPITVLKE